MSKGSRRRPTAIPDPEVTRRWEQRFGLMDATRTPSCDTLTDHLDVRGCEPLPPVGLVPARAPVTVEPDAT